MTAISFPAAPSELPPSMSRLLVQLAEFWAQDPWRPRPSPVVLQHWDDLVAVWANEKSLPLYIRKNENNRGSTIAHRSGRHLVATDNSPAQWAFALAVCGVIPCIEQIREAVEQDKIPVAMIFKGVEKASARYRCSPGGSISPNSAGWKVCHVENIGLVKRGSLRDTPEDLLRRHFRLFMSPSNMFVVPLKYSGLGEIPEFCYAIARLLKAVEKGSAGGST
jgi:hypothetical protein